MSSPMNAGGNIANVERLHALMDRDALSAVVLRSGTNFTYLAGFDYAGTLARHLDFSDSPRGVLIVWPRSGNPVLVLNRFAVERARRDSWIENIVVFESRPASRSVVPAMSSTEAAAVGGTPQWPRERARPRDTASADAVTES